MGDWVHQTRQFDTAEVRLIFEIQGNTFIELPVEPDEPDGAQKRWPVGRLNGIRIEQKGVADGIAILTAEVPDPATGKPAYSVTIEYDCRSEGGVKWNIPGGQRLQFDPRNELGVPRRLRLRWAFVAATHPKISTRRRATVNVERL